VSIERARAPCTLCLSVSLSMHNLCTVYILVSFRDYVVYSWSH
jgi:hypothetical protein